jgi:hypothetical protein
MLNVSSVFCAVRCVLIVFTCIFSYGILHAQSTLKVNGSVSDDSGTPLPGASIAILPGSALYATDDMGHFVAELAAGPHTIIASFVGHANDTTKLNLTGPVTLTIRLKPLSTVMDEVTVTDKKEDEQITRTETGLIQIGKKDLEAMPFLLGEIDPVRMIQLMPGIHTSGEGSTGFYVRGGAIDQNLMLLDNTVVYNPSHLFGFFSIFNGGTIENIDLYKSGIPSYYGGRLSSITNVTTRKGNAEKFQGEGSVGLIAANVLVEGPIRKNKGSFMVAARRTYVDLFLQPMRDLDLLKQNINYFFYDFNVNADYQLGTKDYIRFRGYLGKDDFTYKTISSFNNLINWQNTTASVTWQHNFSDNLYSELSLNTSRYDMGFGASINTYVFNINSDIHDAGATYQLNYKTGKHSLATGIVYTHHTLRPNNINAASEDVELTISPRIKLQGDEMSFFINDKIQFSDNIEASIGARYTRYRQLGPFTRYIEDENFQVLDTVRYAGSTTIQSYGNLEPRVALRYSLNAMSSIKLSYDRTYQYMHMAPLSSVSLPLDIWVPSSEIIKPQYANQFSIGYFRNFREHIIEASSVLYYKKMYNQIEYREGVIIGYSKGYNFDDNFVFGQGESYGFELMVKKNKGRFTGQLSYTLSRTMRQFDALNDGKAFHAKYDRLHDLSVIANYVYNPRWTFSAVFVYGTGNALNLPVARYVIQENIVNEYGERNAFRMPAYHRMDVSATYAAKKTKTFESYWVFSLYNLYNRRNPYYIYFETTGNLAEYELSTSIKQVSLFPVIPAVTYRIKF